MILVHFWFQVRESNFTRTILNPDFVVKKNRQMKHAKALAKTQSVELTIYTDLSPTCYFVKGEEIRLWITRVLERFSTEHKDQKCSELNSLQILVLCSVQILYRTRDIFEKTKYPHLKVLASPIDQVDRVVEGALAKLGVRDDPENYLIAKCIIPVNAELDHCPPRERGTFMEYDECPVDVMNKWDTTKGTRVEHFSIFEKARHNFKNTENSNWS